MFGVDVYFRYIQTKTALTGAVLSPLLSLKVNTVNPVAEMSYPNTQIYYTHEFMGHLDWLLISMCSKHQILFTRC